MAGSTPKHVIGDLRRCCNGLGLALCDARLDTVPVTQTEKVVVRCGCGTEWSCWVMLLMGKKPPSQCPSCSANAMGEKRRCFRAADLPTLLGGCQILVSRQNRNVPSRGKIEMSPLSPGAG